MSKLEAYLADHKVRQTDFARSVGVSQATVSKLVSGAMQPSLDLAVRIERTTGGSVPASSWVPDCISPTPTEDAA